MDALTIITQAQRRAGRVDAGFNARCYEFLNEGIARWALTIPWSTLRQTLDIPSDGTSKIVLPEYVASVQWLADKTNNNAMRNRDFWDREATSTYLQESSGAASWWKEAGLQPVYRQPSSASYISVRSDVSEGRSVYLSGISIDTSSSGTAAEKFFVDETLVIADGTGATSSNMYIEIHSVGKTERSDGDLRVVDATGQIARIPDGKFQCAYRTVEMIRKPAAGTIFRAGILLSPPPIYSAGQLPHTSITPEFLVWYVAGLIHKASNQTQEAELCLQRADRIMSQRAYAEKNFGERDWSAIPDSEYWQYENARSWPQ
jgi:hypothetical protein